MAQISTSRLWRNYRDTRTMSKNIRIWNDVKLVVEIQRVSQYVGELYSHPRQEDDFQAALENANEQQAILGKEILRRLQEASK